MTAAEFDFDQALDALLDATDDQRDALIEKYTKDFPEQEARLRRLLAFALAETRLPDTIDALAPTLIGSMFDAADMERVGSRVGPYKITSLINRGGMGVVFRAERDDGAYEQTVAIKFLPRLVATAQRRELFLNERANLARLEHPNIARIIDAGVTDDKVPYFIMEYVDGEPLDVACQALPEKERLAIFKHICDAVTYCHQSFVVHGDIKPSNILVADGRVRLLDFGVGKWIKHDDQESRWQVAYTEAFAAPEVQRGASHSIASDVYSLGVLLGSVLDRNTDDVGDDDLGHIVRRSTQAIPSDRYASVESLKNDISAYLDGYPIRARQHERGYVARRFISRNKWAVASVLMVVASLVTGLTVAVWQYDNARLEAARATEATVFVKSLFERADEESAGVDDITLRELMEAAVLRLDSELDQSPDVQHDVMALIAAGLHSVGAYDQSRELREAVLAYHRQSKSEPHAQIATAMTALATDYDVAGDFAKSREMFRQAIHQFDELGYESSLELADALRKLGVSMTNYRLTEGDADEAVQALDRASRIVQIAAPDDVYLQYLYLADRARGYSENGEYEKSTGLREQAIEMAEANGFGQYPSAIAMLCNLGVAYDQLGRWREGLDIYEECIRRRSMRLGENHPELIAPRQSLAAAHIALGDFETGRDILLGVVEDAKRQLPEKSFTRLATEVNLARANMLLGSVDAALETLPSILRRMEASVGVDSAAAARVRSVLAKSLFEGGEFTRALELQRDSFNALRASHYWTIQGFEWVSDVHVWRAEAELAANNADTAYELAVDGLAYRNAEANVPDWRIAEAKDVLDRVLAEKSSPRNP
ncbi:MAG: serine/threonine-protein kinase [Pseudomonadota bacterium]